MFRAWGRVPVERHTNSSIESRAGTWSLSLSWVCAGHHDTQEGWPVPANVIPMQLLNLAVSEVLQKARMASVSCPGKNGGDAYHQEDLPKLEFWHPTKEASQAAAQSWLRERMESGDSRNWMAFGHPDPYEVGAGRCDGDQWIFWSNQLPPVPRDERKNPMNRALGWLKWFGEIVRTVAAMAKVIEWLQEVIKWFLLFRRGSCVIGCHYWRSLSNEGDITRGYQKMTAGYGFTPLRCARCTSSLGAKLRRA